MDLEGLKEKVEEERGVAESESVPQDWIDFYLGGALGDIEEFEKRYNKQKEE